MTQKVSKLTKTTMREILNRTIDRTLVDGGQNSIWDHHSFRYWTLGVKAYTLIGTTLAWVDNRKQGHVLTLSDYGHLGCACRIRFGNASGDPRVSKWLTKHAETRSGMRGMANPHKAVVSRNNVYKVTLTPAEALNEDVMGELMGEHERATLANQVNGEYTFPSVWPMGALGRIVWSTTSNGTSLSGYVYAWSDAAYREYMARGGK